MLIEDLRKARQLAGSQRAPASRIDVDAQAIKRLEKGVGSVSTMLAAMAALDCRLTGLGPGKTLPEQLRARRLNGPCRWTQWRCVRACRERPWPVLSGAAARWPACCACWRCLRPAFIGAHPSDLIGVKATRRIGIAASRRPISWAASTQRSADRPRPLRPSAQSRHSTSPDIVERGRRRAHQ